MVPILIQRLAVAVNGVGVHERAQRAAVDHQPGDERAELRGREEVHLEHGYGVRPDGLLPEGVDAEFGDCRGVVSTLPLVQS